MCACSPLVLARCFPGAFSFSPFPLPLHYCSQGRRAAGKTRIKRLGISGAGLGCVGGEIISFWKNCFCRDRNMGMLPLLLGLHGIWWRVFGADRFGVACGVA